jgi:hypothetical protein
MLSKKVRKQMSGFRSSSLSTERSHWALEKYLLSKKKLKILTLRRHRGKLSGFDAG